MKFLRIIFENLTMNLASQEPKYSREELLYLARLAEQCDRFDGKFHYVLPKISLQKWLITFLNSQRLEKKS